MTNEVKQTPMVATVTARKKRQTKTKKSVVQQEHQSPITVIEPEVFPTTKPSDALEDRLNQGEAKVGVACEPLTRLSIPMGDQLLAERKKQRQQSQMSDCQSVGNQSSIQTLADLVNGQVDEETLQAVVQKHANSQLETSNASIEPIQSVDLNEPDLKDKAAEALQPKEDAQIKVASEMGMEKESSDDQLKINIQKLGVKRARMMRFVWGTLCLAGWGLATALWLGWYPRAGISVGVVDRLALREVLLAEAKTARLSEMEVWMNSFDQDVFRHTQTVAAETGAVLLDARAVIAAPVRRDFTPLVAEYLKSQWHQQREDWALKETKDTVEDGA